MNKPKLVIPRSVFDKVLHWCIIAKGLEISGLGKCKYDAKTNTFTVVDAQVLQQSIQSAGNTEITAEAIGKFMYETRDQGDIMWWWHSHHSMGAFWSGTDRECIASFAKDGGVVATVFNNKGETLSAAQFKTTTMLGESLAFHDQLEMSIVTYYDNAVFEQWDKEYEAAKLKYQPTVQNQIGFQGLRKPLQPPKKLRKVWEKLPEDQRIDVIFEDPKGEDWIWMSYSKEWRTTTEWDYHRIKKYFVDGIVFNDELRGPGTKMFSEAELAAIEADPDDDDSGFLDKMYDEKARVLAGMSPQEWGLLNETERNFYYDRYGHSWNE